MHYAATVKVVVVGAGVSGLSAAQHLVASKGVESVVVLEARERVGGRVHTRPVGRRRPLELGAEWIRGACPANSLFNLANRCARAAVYEINWTIFKSANDKCYKY